MSGQTVSLRKILTRFLNNMLVRTVILPSVFTSISEKETSFYRLVINLLINLEKNGLILTDEQEYIQKVIISGIGNWPQKYRKQAQVVLKRLKEKNRFVNVSIKNESKLSCITKPCNYCINLALDYCPTAVMTRQECYLCAKKHLEIVNTVKVVDIVEDSISDFFPNDYVLRKGEWTQQKFEQKILIPLLRDAKNVKIYDRYIGRSIFTPSSTKYKLVLEWILDVFLRERGSKFKGVFEVYGGVGIGIRKNQIPTAVSKLRDLENELQKKYPNFQLFIKKENPEKQMLHDRYLITDQVAVSLGRGFNLLDGKNHKLVQDTNINYCSEPGKIEQHVRTLPNL